MVRERTDVDPAIASEAKISVEESNRINAEADAISEGEVDENAENVDERGAAKTLARMCSENSDEPTLVIINKKKRPTTSIKKPSRSCKKASKKNKKSRISDEEYGKLRAQARTKASTLIWSDNDEQTDEDENKGVSKMPKTASEANDADSKVKKKIT